MELFDIHGQVLFQKPCCRSATSRVPLRRRATLRVGIRTSNDCAHSPEWSRDPSADRNSGALDLVILDDRATPANGVAPRPSKKCRLAVTHTPVGTRPRSRTRGGAYIRAGPRAGGGDPTGR